MIQRVGGGSMKREAGIVLRHIVQHEIKCDVLREERHTIVHF